jgi:hypothetical protein
MRHGRWVRAQTDELVNLAHVAMVHVVSRGEGFALVARPVHGEDITLDVQPHARYADQWLHDLQDAQTAPIQ